jgi:hypothetical protein
VRRGETGRTTTDNVDVPLRLAFHDRESSDAHVAGAEQ